MDDLTISAVSAVEPAKPAQDVRALAAASPSRNTPAPAPAVPPTEAQMVASATAFEHALATRNLHLRFASAKGMQILTELVDETTGKVIRQIPAGRLSEMLTNGSHDFSGLFVDAVG